MSNRRVALVAGADERALHGVEGRFAWGEGHSFAPDDTGALAAWAPATVIAIGALPPRGPWRAIVWSGRALLPAADALAGLRSKRGSGVLVVGGTEAVRESAVARTRASFVDAAGAERLTVDGLERAAVVALLGTPGEPMPAGAAAVLAAGRVLVAPRAEPAFGLLPWSDHVPYENEDDIAYACDMAETYAEAFEPIVAMGILAAEAHLASAVYGRLAIDAELEALALSAAP